MKISFLCCKINKTMHSKNFVANKQKNINCDNIPTTSSLLNFKFNKNGKRMKMLGSNFGT